jgi:hypothetical protein
VASEEEDDPKAKISKIALERNLRAALDKATVQDSVDKALQQDEAVSIEGLFQAFVYFEYDEFLSLDH